MPCDRSFLPTTRISTSVAPAGTAPSGKTEGPSRRSAAYRSNCGPIGLSADEGLDDRRLGSQHRANSEHVGQGGALAQAEHESLARLFGVELAARGRR